jgi:hypothetical protein
MRSGVPMTVAMRRLRKLILDLAFSHPGLSRLQFRGGTGEARLRLEQAKDTLLRGLYVALVDDRPEALLPRLNAVEAEWRSVAFMGAAMGLELLDQLTPWRRDRWCSFLEGAGAPHIFHVHLGAGLALARLRRPVERPLARLDAIVRWAVVSGYGMHEGLFNPRRYVEQQALPVRLSGYARRIFDQGIGESLWMLEGADVGRIPATIAGFAPSRQPDLWSGLGSGCSYLGGADRAGLEALRAAAGPYRAHLAQGATCGAKARQLAGNQAASTELANEVLCGLSADAAARLSDGALESLPPDGAEPAFEVWRRRVRAHFATEVLER